MGIDDPFDAVRRYQELYDSLTSKHIRSLQDLIPRNYALEALQEQQRRIEEMTAATGYRDAILAMTAETQRARELMATAYDSRTLDQLRALQTDLDRTFDQATGIDRMRLTTLTEDYYARLARAAGVDVLGDINRHIAAMSAIVPVTMRDPLVSEVLENILGTRMTLAEHLSGLRDMFPSSIAGRIESTVCRTTRLFEGYSARVLPTLPGLPEGTAIAIRGRVTTSSRGVLASAEVVEYLDQDADDDGGHCEPDGVVLQLLYEFDAALVEQYVGAIAAFNRRGPDSPRHVAISLRELLKFVVEGAAPTDAVLDWLSTIGERPQARPTDRERLRYIWQGHRPDEMVLVSSQMKTIGAFLIALNEPTHAKRFNAAAMRAYIRSFESAILLILQSQRRR